MKGYVFGQKYFCSALITAIITLQGVHVPVPLEKHDVTKALAGNHQEVRSSLFLLNTVMSVT
jgi:hypothetical protein